MLRCPDAPFDVIRIENSSGALRNDAAENSVALDQRQFSKILAIKPEQVERVEPLLSTATQKRIELPVAMGHGGTALGVTKKGGRREATTLFAGTLTSVPRS